MHGNKNGRRISNADFPAKLPRRNLPIVDEPTSALDDTAKGEVESLIRDIIGETHLA